VKVSKRIVAREWLIFVAFLPLGGIASFVIEYNQNFDLFWNQWFGFKEP